MALGLRTLCRALESSTLQGVWTAGALGDIHVDLWMKQPHKTVQDLFIYGAVDLEKEPSNA